MKRACGSARPVAFWAAPFLQLEQSSSSSPLPSWGRKLGLRTACRSSGQTPGAWAAVLVHRKHESRSRVSYFLKWWRTGFALYAPVCDFSYDLIEQPALGVQELAHSVFQIALIDLQGFQKDVSQDRNVIVNTGQLSALHKALVNGLWI